MSSEVKNVQVRLSLELADWYDETFPGLSKQAFGESCFKQLKLAVDEGRIVPLSHITEDVVMQLFSREEK
jgi:hypothetical protein